MYRTYSIVLAALLAVPSLARAQETPPQPGAPAPQAPAAEPASPGENPGNGEGEKKDDSALPPSNDTTPRDFGGAYEPGELGDKKDEHTVLKGDTLWDLSSKYLGNPWYWPKVWSYNPEIENPHWIYPGDEVRFYPQADVEEGEPIKEDLADVSKGNWDAPTYGEDDDVTVAGRIGYGGPKHLLARHDGFVTDRELAESGDIQKSWAEKNLLSAGDRIYVRFRDRSGVKAGQDYVIFRTAREIRHPQSGDRLGYLTTILGSAKVVEREGSLVTLVIDRSFGEMERGDSVGPVAGAFVRSVSPKPNARNAVGVICATMEADVGSLAQWSLVFLDIGRRQGVEEGNTLQVIRAGDPIEKDDGFHPFYDLSAPRETLGKLLVLDTKDTTSAALVMQSARELRIGDRVEMQAGSAPTPAATPPVSSAR